MERRNDDRIGCGPMTLALPVIAIMLACGITEIRQDAGSEPVLDELEFPDRAVCCVTGIEYPSGYDWMEDEATDEVKRSLVVFADAVPCLKVPVGDGYEVSGDSDMHRFLDGNLYTYYSKDSLIVVHKNRAPLFRYHADEVLLDMCLKGSDLHTLSQKMSGGFSYRINGVLALEKLSGETFGRFWEDEGKVCFAYGQPVAMNGGLDKRYYLVCDSNIMHVPFEQDVSVVWDIMSRHGAPCSLVSSAYDSRTYLLRDGRFLPIDIPLSSSMLSCRMFYADDKMGVECAYETAGGEWEGGVWIEGSEYLRFETDRPISHLSYAEGKVCCVLNPGDSEEEDSSGEGVGLIYDGATLHQMPEGYFCIGSAPVAIHEGELYVALSSNQGDRPVIWHGGQLDTLKMNGYVCSISF